MHITDGILSGPMIIATSSLAVVGVGVGLKTLDYQQIPKVGLLASAFFMASFVNIPVGPVHSHLLLCGLMGILLKWQAFIAVLAAITLQTLLFGIGGVSSLGANVLTMASASVIACYLCGWAIHPGMSAKSAFAWAFAAGAAGVIVAAILLAVILLVSGKEYLRIIQVVLAWHTPIMIIEGFVTAWAVTLLLKVRPEIFSREKDPSHETP